MRYRIFSVTLVWFGSYFQRVSKPYRQVYKKMNVNIFFKKMMVTGGNPFQIAPNHAKLRKMFGNTFGNALSYGNAFHYGLSMLNWEKMYGNAFGNGAGNLFKLW